LTVEPMVRSKPLRDRLEIQRKKDPPVPVDADNTDAYHKITEWVVDSFVEATKRRDYPGPSLDHWMSFDDFWYLWNQLVDAWLPEDEGEFQGEAD